jgi:hypothetical protein
VPDAGENISFMNISSKPELLSLLGTVMATSSLENYTCYQIVESGCAKAELAQNCYEINGKHR